MQTPMTSCHLIPMWYKWNMNAVDVMVAWFISYVNLVTSCWACTSHAHMHGTHAVSKMGVLEYSNGLTGMQTNSNLRKLTASHFNALNTQNANKNMPNMFLIVYLNETLRYCNKNLAWVNKNPSFIPMCFGTQQKVRRGNNCILLYLLVDIITLKTFQIIFL